MKTFHNECTVKMVKVRDWGRVYRIMRTEKDGMHLDKKWDRTEVIYLIYSMRMMCTVPKV
jgi:hypothetical protein